MLLLEGWHCIAVGLCGLWLGHGFTPGLSGGFLFSSFF